MVSQINKVILKSLETGDKYGLEIIKDIADFTNGKVNVKQPTLYSALRRMEKKGYITSFWQDSALGGRRHYYSLTNAGKDEIKNAAPTLTDEEINELLREVNKSRANQKAQDDLENSENEDIKVEKIVIKEPEPTPEPEPEPKIEPVKQQPILKNRIAFEQFDPNAVNIENKSFSQQMREYVEPTNNYELETTSPVKQEVNDEPAKPEPIELPTTIEQKPVVKNSFSFINQEPDVEFIMDDSPKYNSKDDINYKDILGELDANNTTATNEIKFHEVTPIINEEPKIILSKPTSAPAQKSEYAKQVEEIITSRKSTKEQEEIKTAIYQKHNQSTLEEINRRYNLNDTKKTPVETNTIKPANVVYTHIKQENISVRPYSKVENKNFITKNFLNISQFNICRAVIMSIIFIVEVLLSYFLLRNTVVFNDSQSYLYWVFLGMTVVYMGVILLLNLKDINKKVRISDITWSMNFFYRLLLAVVLFTFVVAVCLCFGMNGFSDPDFFSIWYLPALAILDIMVSWLVGLLIYSTKKFRA